ncbi:MAG TPA: methylated-DNA--[protein]-cysteine S-methyltransferase [Luteolibacter sp.]|nr:methylated-DNA--[protein]-cysteine S-methyltransferase [Luteolibacter sp.]
MRVTILKQAPVGEPLVTLESTPFGTWRIEEVGGAIVSSAFIEKVAKTHAKPGLAKRIFQSTERSSTTLTLAPRGTPFQLEVWRALLRVPRGQTISYAQLAARIGRPSAVRAVASAVARNPIAVLIPCHRVVRSDGTPGEYRWGAPRKQALLEWEKEVLR